MEDVKAAALEKIRIFEIELLRSKIDKHDEYISLDHTLDKIIHTVSKQFKDTGDIHARPHILHSLNNCRDFLKYKYHKDPAKERQLNSTMLAKAREEIKAVLKTMRHYIIEGLVSLCQSS